MSRLRISLVLFSVSFFISCNLLVISPSGPANALAVSSFSASTTPTPLQRMHANSNAPGDLPFPLQEWQAQVNFFCKISVIIVNIQAPFFLGALVFPPRGLQSEFLTLREFQPPFFAPDPKAHPFLFQALLISDQFEFFV